MVGPKRPGPAPLPVAEKRVAVALVKVTPAERVELEAWAKREGRPLAALLRDAGLSAARVHTSVQRGHRDAKPTKSAKPARSR